MKKNIVFFLLVVFLFILPLSVFAATSMKEVQQVDEARQANEQEGTISRETYLVGTYQQSGVMQDLTVGAFELFAGKSDGQGGTTGGALQSGGKMIANLFESPPASSQLYVADLMHNMNIAQPAYAQGIGFAALSPILEGWKIFRNLAYFFFVLIFLIIGFLIMLRKKVGQAAVSAQQAIPKIIVAMLAVTFSYAIAGLLIDLMYVFMYLVVGLFGDRFTSGVNINSNIFDLGKEIVTMGFENGKRAITSFVDEMLTGEIPEGIVKDSIGWIAGVTGGLIIAVAAVYATFKLFFELLKTYITILISILMSPLQLMMEAIPGQSHFGKWIKGLIGNLAAFPTVLLVLVLYKLLIVSGGDGSASGFMPPFLLNGLAVDISAVNFLVGFGLLLGLPEAVKTVKKKLGASDGGAFGSILQSGAKEAMAHKGLGMAAGRGATGALLGAGAGGLAAIGSGIQQGRGNYNATRDEGFGRGRAVWEGLKGGGKGLGTGAVKYGLGGAAAGGVGGILAPKAYKGVKSMGKEVIREGVGAGANIMAGDAVDSLADRYNLDYVKKLRAKGKKPKGRTPAPGSGTGSPPPTLSGTGPITGGP